MALSRPSRFAMRCIGDCSSRSPQGTDQETSDSKCRESPRQDHTAWARLLATSSAREGPEPPVGDLWWADPNLRPGGPSGMLARARRIRARRQAPDPRRANTPSLADHVSTDSAGWRRSEALEPIREASEFLSGCSGGAGTGQMPDNFVSIHIILPHRRFTPGTLLLGPHQK